MKIILSRKGFDSACGGHPSLILPDGKLVSLPIPQPGDLIRYSDLEFMHDITYYDLMRQLFTEIQYHGKNIPLTLDTECHLDPDISCNTIKRSDEWQPLFGQSNGAQTHLHKQNVQKGDAFLFFGKFRRTECVDNNLAYSHDTDKHIIWGYLQIGDIFNPSTEIIPEWMRYHSHTLPYENRSSNNIIYIATSSLSWKNNLPGAGLFSYDESLVLTQKGCSCSKWEFPPYLHGIRISYHDTSSWEDTFFQSRYRGQEFVIEEKLEVENWAKNLIEKNVLK